MSATDPQLLDVIDSLIAEIAALNMQNAVQRSAWLVLVRHLSKQGFVDPGTLAGDLLTMGQTESDSGWQSGHAAIAELLRQL